MPAITPEEMLLQAYENSRKALLALQDLQHDVAILQGRCVDSILRPGHFAGAAALVQSTTGKQAWAWAIHPNNMKEILKWPVACTAMKEIAYEECELKRGMHAMIAGAPLYLNARVPENELWATDAVVDSRDDWNECPHVVITLTRGAE